MGEPALLAPFAPDKNRRQAKCLSHWGAPNRTRRLGVEHPLYAVRMQETAPHAEYQARLDRWRAIHAGVSARFDIIAYARLAIFLSAAVLLLLVFARHLFSAWIVLAPLVAFIALVVWHDRVARVQQRAARAIQYYERGLARLD